MDLGKSLRRRRAGSKNGGKGAGKNSRSSARSRSSGWPLGRILLVAFVTLLVGTTTGYLYATQVSFPGEEDSVAALLEVPDLRGGSEAEASDALRARNLEVGRVDSIRHPTISEGQVVGQTPFPGQFVVQGGRVEITVSLGPERRPIPDVTRLRVDRAVTVLRTTGFEVAVDSIDHDDPAGRVVATEPEVGTHATLPSDVRLLVSLGPPMVELPDLVGRQVDEAREALEELGLTVGEVETRFQFGFRRGEVLATTPAAGELIPRGGEVNLEVGTRGVFQDDGEDE
ncbi:MAG: PASTA domain-containing protein [Gemmatimonadales bacterium]|nr:MAG: PASTA domain-containing protein [Gemmatimonadales bacterium]